MEVKVIYRLPYNYSSSIFRHNNNAWNVTKGLRSLSTKNYLEREKSQYSNGINRSSQWRSKIAEGIWCRSLPNMHKYQYMTSVRLMHSGNDDNVETPQALKLPPLMSFPPIIWPKFTNAVRNWFFIHFIIKAYFDKEFSIQEFLDGAKEAVSVVANKLSEGKLDDLEGLVDPTALAQIRESLSKFTVFQQQLLRVAVEDIFFAFPYQIGIIIPDETPRDQYPEGVKPPPQTRHVEITVSLHVLRGLSERQRNAQSGTGGPFNFQEFAQDERNNLNFMICNYRFFRDFTEGCPDPSWIINMVNHFLPMELAAHQKNS